MSTRESTHMQTRASLLLNMKHYSESHWQEFYDLYSSLIYHYARGKGCSDTMASDVLQETLMTLYRKLPDFDYDSGKGKFRSWLMRITHSRMVDAWRREKKYLTDEDVQEHAFRDRKSVV